MDKDTRNSIQRATQAARTLLEREFAEQLEGIFDIHIDRSIDAAPGSHLDAEQRVLRTKMLAAVDHQRASGLKHADAVANYLREAAFTMLNRCVALKMLEARGLVQECVSRGDQSAGFKEFTGLAPGLVQLPDHGYRFYIESIFDEIGCEVRVLFDRRDPPSLLWPRRQTFLELLAILNASDLAEVWKEDETIGWVYQYFNGDNERRKMRAESQAPRNGRELAVRNQFFTPRYVVEFLTDNTLGRLWYEMCQGKTKLVDACDFQVRSPNAVFLAEGQMTPEDEAWGDENLSQVESLKKAVYLPFRTKKDPRHLKILDPACGSGHFLLYAFDLLVLIYEEGWEDKAAPISTTTGRCLRGDYSSLDDLRRALPRLILRHNLHGIDIDPRATQIAALALWMRAQRSYNDFGIARDDRPPITKTNIVLAEAMPGEKDLRDEFVASLDKQLGTLFQRVLDKMELAGETGSLLMIEEHIHNSIEEIYTESGPLFRKTDEECWRAAETEFLLALRNYAEQAREAGSYRRRLFVEDAARGLGLVDLCQQIYDVVLMNPPFGETSPDSKSHLFSEFPDSKYDLGSAFISRAVRFAPQGYIGALANRSIYFAKMLERWREDLYINNGNLTLFADLGVGVLDGALVEAVAVVHTPEARRGPSVFLKATSEGVKLRSVVAAYNELRLPDHGELFSIDVRRFRAIPDRPFAYWIPDSWLRSFDRFLPLSAAGVLVRQGMESSDNFRFVRLWWETPAQSTDWKSYSKGGSFGPQWHGIDVVVNWAVIGREVKAFSESIYGTWTKQITNSHLYGRPGICYPASRVEFSPRILSADSIVGCKGPIVCFEDETRPFEDLIRLLAVLSSASFRSLLNLTTTSGDTMSKSYREQAVSAISAPPLASVPTKAIELVRRIIIVLQECESADDRQLLFHLPMVQYDIQIRTDEIRRLRDELDDLMTRLYGFEGNPYIRLSQTGYDDLVEYVSGGADVWVTYFVGVAFGRYSRKVEKAGTAKTDDATLFSRNSPSSICPEESIAMRSMTQVIYAIWRNRCGRLRRRCVAPRRQSMPLKTSLVIQLNMRATISVSAISIPTFAAIHLAAGRHPSIGNSLRVRRATPSGSTTTDSPETPSMTL